MGQLSAFMKKSMRVKARNKGQLVCEIVPPIILLILAVAVSRAFSPQEFLPGTEPFSAAIVIPPPCVAFNNPDFGSDPRQPIYLTTTSATSSSSADLTLISALAARMNNATRGCGIGAQFVPGKTVQELFDARQAGWTAGVEITVARGGAAPRLEYTLRMPNQNGALALWKQVPLTVPTTNGGVDDAFKRTLASLISNRADDILCENGQPCDQHPYAVSGFSGVQLLLENTFRSLVGSAVPEVMKPFLEAENMRVTYFPHPGLIRAIDRSIVAQYLGFSYISSTFVLVKQMLSEKERRIKEGMYIMSMKTSTFWVGWFLTALVSVVPISLIVLLAGLGLIFEKSSPGLVVAVIFLFAISLVALTFLIYTIFRKPRSGGTFLLILQIIGIVAYSTIEQQRVSGDVLRFLSLLSPLAFLRAARLMAQGVKDASATSYSIGQAIGMLFLDIVLYFGFAWYFDKVIPGEYGQPLPWYFPFSPAYWQSRKQAGQGKQGAQHEESPRAPFSAYSSGGASGVVVEMQPLHADRIQPLPAGSDISVRVENLRKVFRVNPFKDSDEDKIAVNGLSFSMLRGQIFSLLGHNGAGKTTTISMMTGMIPITSGDILVNGRSVKTDIDSVHKSMGFCPQHDVLYDELSVEEHLELYGEIKGLSGEALRSEIDRLIPAVDLQLKRHNRVHELSGGMKRKLSVAIAYIANPELVILDEPTAGLDPLSRRKIWELINSNKTGRTTLLTTHFLDEADILGDRIGIMANGVMKCLGTSLFLKQRFGLGYTLGIVKDPPVADAEEVRRFVKSQIPSADEQTCTRGEQSFRLPMQEKARFPHLLSGLRQVRGVISFGLSITTLEEVFLRIADDSEEFMHQHKPGQVPQQQQQQQQQQQLAPGPLPARYGSAGVSYATAAVIAPTGVAPQQAAERDLEAARPAISQSASFHANRDNSGRVMAQAHAILLKRLWQTKRSILSFFINLIVPIVLLFVGGAFATFAASLAEQKPVVLQPANIWEVPLSNFFYSVDPNGMLPPLPNNAATSISLPMVNGAGLGSSSTPLTRLDVGPSPPMFSTITNRLLDLWKASPDGILDYPAALAFGGIQNASALTLFNNFRITHSLPVLVNQLPRWFGASGDVTIIPSTYPLIWQAGAADVTVFVFVSFFVFAFSFPPGYIGVPLVSERVNKTRHLLRLMGMRSGAYWVVTAVFDWFYLFIPSVFAVIAIAVFDVTPLSKNGMGPVIICLLLYQCAAIFFVYVVARLMSAPENFQLFSITTGVVVGLLGTIAYFVLDLVGTINRNDGLKLASDVIFYILNLVPIFNVSVSLYRIGTPPQYGLKWSDPSFEQIMHPDTKVRACMGYQVGNIFLYALILAVLETNWFNRLVTSRGVTTTEPTEPTDSDVIEEKRRLLAPGAPQDTISMQGLRKVYPARGKVPEKVAVNSMYLGIPQGEVFGLLGANGAGKTTTMKMLTGDINPSGGAAFVDAHDISSDIDGAYKVMGYCPQFDALWPDLTGREHLRIFSMIKGVPDSQAKELSESMLTNMSLGPYADKLAGTYSGGNKRKLSVTVALMASPKVVYLDEPSTGMDPASRRYMWSEISSSMNSRAVILTTHSMEEADALCNRIGIVVNGELVCLGSSQHLKNKFGTGLQIETSTTPEMQERVIAFVNQMFPNAQVVQSFAGNISMEVEAPGVDLGAVFMQFESAKEQLRILDYSISQTTLEQVFLRFARGQIQEERGQA